MKVQNPQYLQNEHYALWEVIEFGDSYKAPPEESGKGPTSESSARKKGRTVAITMKDIQKRRNDAEGSETLEQTFNRLQAIRNRDDLDTISLDDVYNHLKFYEPEVQKKLESNSQNIAFISSSNTSSGKGEVHTASVPTASIQVSTASTDVAASSLSHDTICHFARECRAPRSQDKGKRESYIQGPKEEEPTPKALMAIDMTLDGIGETREKLLRPQLVGIRDLNKILLNKDSGCSWHMTGNISYLSKYEPYGGGYVSFGHGGGKITGKGIIKTGKLEFENVYFVKELKYNLFSVSQICDNKNNVMFTDSECLVLGKDFKLNDDTNVASVDESMLWHKRLGHLNFKTMNKLVRNNLVKGLPSKCFENDHTCVACLKGKQHKASCKTKLNKSRDDLYEEITSYVLILIETMNLETKIIATVDGKPRTISESSLRTHLKLNDEDGISSLPDAELFKNLSLMGYNILPNQRIVPLFASMIVTQGEGFANPTEPHHTPSPQEQYSPQHDSPPLSHQPIIPEPIPHDPQAPTETLTLRRLTRRAIRIAQSKALSPDSDEPASLSRDDRQGEAFPTGSMQQRLHELMELCTSLQRQQSQMADKIKDQDIEISRLKAKVKSLKDKERRREEPIQEDAPIKWGIIDIGEELGANKSTEKGSNDTEEMVNVLSSTEATNILVSGGATVSVSPADVFPTAGVPTVRGSFPTVSAIFTTASVATPYTRRSRGITIGSLRPMRIPIISAKDKGKEKVTETKVLKKKKLQEQIDAQVAREMEEEFVRENQRLSKHAVRDSKIVRIHAEEELKLMIGGLDRSNEVIAKHLSEYE
nr:ribonuclease H-like domain-containing protein [Tanacetum cinerariifolium]